MKITAADISQKQCMVTPEGLDSEEVYAFLEAVKEDMYDLDKEKAVLDAPGYKGAVESAHSLRAATFCKKWVHPGHFFRKFSY